MTNGQSDPATLTFPWTITQLALATPSDQFNVTGDAAGFLVQVDNPRGGALTYSADGLPDGLAINPASGLIAGVIASSAAGGMPWRVRIAVTDGTETASREFDWKVWPGVAGTILRDGGFENPHVGAGGGAFSYGPSGSAWTFNGSGISGNGSGFTWGNPVAPEGQQVAFLQGTGTISQALAGWAAGSYQISFQAAQRGSVQASSQDFQVLVDDRVVGTFRPTGTTYETYTTAAFPVGSGAHTITFQGLNTNGGDNTVFLDAVAVTVAAPVAPPLGDAGLESVSVGGGGYAYYPSGSAWTFASVGDGGAGLIGNGSPFTWGNPTAPQGSQVAFLQSNGTISQSIPGWATGTYRLSFQAAQRGNNGISNEDFQILLDGAVIATVKPSSTTYQTYTTPDFAVTAGTHTLSFRGLNSAGGDNTAFIDDIAISAVGGGTTSPPGSYSLPVISLVNPGNQVNRTNDVISLPIRATASADDTFYYSATGLPIGLSIDPATGLISGMNDNFSDDDATNGVDYNVWITVTDEYEQTRSQSFNWHFNPPVSKSSMSAHVESDPPGSFNPRFAPNAEGAGIHPTTESRDDSFDIEAFWQNVEKLPGGQAAANWFARQNGRVDWGWTLSLTHGRWESNDDGPHIPVVHIPWTYNEATAASSFVVNITQSWVTGFADYSKIPTTGDPGDWREYLKARTKAQGEVVVAGAEAYLAAMTFANEGLDWAVTVGEVSSAKTFAAKVKASIGFLPFVSSGTVKFLSNSGEILLKVSSKQQKLINKFLDDYVKAGFGTAATFVGVVQRPARNGTTAIVLQRSVQIHKQNVLAMAGHYASYGRFKSNPRWIYGAPKDANKDLINLHHVDQVSEANGVLAGIPAAQNRTGNLLHPGSNGVEHSPLEDQINAAEALIQLNFPPSYRLFLSHYGAMKYGDHEIFGLFDETVNDDFGFTNVVDKTLRCRMEDFAKNLKADHLIFFAEDQDGTIYYTDSSQTTNDQVPVFATGSGFLHCKITIDFLDFFRQLVDSESSRPFGL